jgi:myosin-1
MRYKNECARRIQRFWKANKENIEYARVRDYGHQLLGGRKERRRFSLLGYRRFMGDYLGAEYKNPLGQELKNIAEICEYPCVDCLKFVLTTSASGKGLIQWTYPAPSFEAWSIE